MTERINPIIVQSTPSTTWEILERKGLGHPDTLADALAEELSIGFSCYTRDQFGAILHHNFDKVSILGGSSRVTFNVSEMTSPIRVILNGRATQSFGSTAIPVRDILEDIVYKFFSDRFTPFLERKDIRIIYELSTSSTPGAVEGYSGATANPRHRWFSPRSLDDLPELKTLSCNDTAVACYTPPTTLLSRHVLEIERLIHSSPTNNDGRVGTDIKIMGARYDRQVKLTIAIPLLANRIGSIDEFFDTLKSIKKYLTEAFREQYPDHRYDVTINPLDNRATGDIYMTHCGSCIETGDEGVVGRGNRLGGLIRVNRPISMEGICGKNPVYHTGKVLAGAAYLITHDIFSNPKEETTLYLVGQRGRSLRKPWFVVLECPDDYWVQNQQAFEETLRYRLANLGQITERFIKRQIPLY